MEDSGVHAVAVVSVQLWLNSISVRQRLDRKIEKNSVLCMHRYTYVYLYIFPVNVSDSMHFLE